MGNYQFGDAEDKAGYNQAGKIVEVLAVLRATFINSMLRGNLGSALKCIRRVLDVISGKVREEDITKLNNRVYEIEDKLPMAEATYLNAGNGQVYVKNPKQRREVEREIENLYRDVERTQDQYGYGMFSEEEGGL